jgi:hypothetical protein
MDRGYLFHAYNNMEIDYGTMALCSALLIKKNLRFNQTAIVTTTDTLEWLEAQHSQDLINRAFDRIILVDRDFDVADRTFRDTRYASKVQPYYNTNRVDSFNLSPFEETILIDADYLVLDDSLDSVWGSVEDLMVNRSVRDLRHTFNTAGFDSRFNEMSIPLYWATVVYFKRTDRAKTMFDLMRFVKENYDYYRNLYQFSSSGYYRNDYSLSIALHMMNGQLENETVVSLPFPDIFVATEFDDMVDFKNNQAIFLSEFDQGHHRLHKVMTNIHVMNKWSISRMASRIISYAIS